MKPAELDAAINGVAVYFYQRPSDGTIYASHFNFDRFRATPLKTIRVPLDKVGEGWSTDTCPVVITELAKLRTKHRKTA